MPATLAAPAALLGGALWILYALLGGGSGPLADTLHVVGLVGLLVAAAVSGSGLVRSGARAMKIVVALASALLVLSLVEAFRPADTPWYDGFWGIVAVVLGAVGMVRGRARTDSRPDSGSRAV